MGIERRSLLNVGGTECGRIRELAALQDAHRAARLPRCAVIGEDPRDLVIRRRVCGERSHGTRPKEDASEYADDN